MLARWERIGLIVEADANGGAVFSHDRKHRYYLWRHVVPGSPIVAAFVMLNPSTAGGGNDDATIRSLLGFAYLQRWGKFVVVNLLSGVSTDPGWEVPMSVSDGFRNREAHQLACAADLVVAAWGARPGGWAFGPDLESFKGTPLYCLGRTKSGQPRHPLHIRRDTPLICWDVPAALTGGN